MAIETSEVLNAANMDVVLFCQGMSRAGFYIPSGQISANSVVSFSYSQDGVTFKSLTVTPFASGTGVQSTAVAGSWWCNCSGFVAVRMQYTTFPASGVVQCLMAASIDASYQVIFLASTARMVNSVSTANATNTLTVAAQANRRWRMRTLTISAATAPTWASSPALTIKDGTTVLWAGDPTTTVGIIQVPLPDDPRFPGVSGGGLVNSPGAAMSAVLVAAGAGIVTNMNAEMIPA